MSLFDEPTVYHNSAHLSPPREADSDRFATDIGDMLDDFSPADKDDVCPREEATLQDDNKKQSSLYDVDEDMLLPPEQDLDKNRESDHLNAQQGTKKSAGPFLEVSDDSAFLDLGIRAKDQASSSTMTKTNLGYEPAAPEGKGLYHDDAFHSASDERPASSDSTMKAFMEELGTELFNFTG